MNEEQVNKNTIYKVVHGSRAYGTHMPESDRDEKGIAIATDPKFYYGFSKFEQKDSGWADGNDRVIYDIRKFFRLAMACNPNIIEVLFVEDEDVLVCTDEGREIRAAREMFLSKKAAKTFGGYAHSQLKRLQSKMAHGVDARARKHAAHLVRLLRMGQEILRDGEVLVRRPDAEYLLAIRSGEVALDEVVRFAQSADEELKRLESKSLLPPNPPYDVLEELMMDLICRKLTHEWLDSVSK